MATEKRDLRTGRTVWQGRRFHRVSAKPLRGDRTTDILIVGAGITGAVVAQALAADGHAVMLVDRRGPAAGATAASTALVQYEIDMPLTLLSRRIGKEKAMRAWRRSRLALDSLAATLATLNVPDVARRDTLYLAGDVLDPAALRREGAARRAAGLETRYLTRGGLRKTFGIRAQAALMGYGNLAIDPCRSTHALLNDAVAHGATIFAPAEITDIEANARQVFAATSDGARIRTRTLIFASGYEMPHGVPMCGHKIISTWAFATAPQPKRLWPGEALIWEAADPYLYIRTTRDGRVICGGEDEEFSDEEKRDALIARKTKTLQRKLAKRIPGLDTRAEFTWTGSFGHSDTGLPTIGKVPGMPNCWAALGYGGNGITYARLAAEIIRGDLAGTPDADAGLYAFARRRGGAAAA